MILTAVFLLSLSSLTFEVLLTRVFSISQWNHLSFMVISIALFGFAASGTFLSILDTRKKGWGKRLSSTGPVKISIILYTITAIASFLVLNRIPLDYFRLPLEPIQTLYLLIAYLILSLPFFFTGLIVSLAYSYFPEKTGFVYFASMAGSAFGAFIPVPFLPLFGEGRLIIIAALIPLILLPFGVSKPATGDLLRENAPRKRQIPFLASALGISVIATILIFSKGGLIVEVKSSPYKSLSQILQFPGTRIIESVTSLRGKIDSIKSPSIRFAPGLSLKFKNELPSQWAAFRDGDDPFVLYNLSGHKDVKFSRYTLPYSGYLLSPSLENVLLVQNGGGSGIICAISSNAGEITIVEQNPQIARIVRSHYNLPVVNQNHRAFLAQSHKQFNIIHVENWGPSLPGIAALNQEHLFTIDAFTEYLNHLTKDGVLIISRKLLLPPADSIRLWAGAYEALRSLKIESPEHHIVLLRSWDTFTLIVSAKPLHDLSIIKEFARNLNFDLVYFPGITSEMANRFNIFDMPYHFLEINRLAQAYRSCSEKKFFQTCSLDVLPQSDSRPFPSRFLKWFKLEEIYKSTGSRPYSLLMSGEIVVAVVFFEALLVAFLLLVLPLFAIPKKGKKPSISQIIYFLSVGAGFMFVELFFIKEYILLFGDPVISFTVVLTGFLVFSGAGGYWSQRMKQQSLRYSLIALITFLILVFISLDTLVHKILGFSVFFRYVLAFLLLMPTGLLVGLPFPLGMRYLLENPVQRAYAWAVNGCASVLTSILAAQIALSVGIPAIMACAASAYIVVFLSANRRLKLETGY